MSKEEQKIDINKKRTEKEMTAVEKKRLKIFKEAESKLIEEGYEKHDLTTTAEKANIYAIVTALPFLVILCILYFVFHTSPIKEPDNLEFALLVLINCIVIPLIHELIHGIAWACFAKDHFKNIGFGFIRKTLTPYCTCMTPLKKTHYIIGCFMPCLLLGIIPAILSIFVGGLSLFISGCFQVACAGGDLLVLFMIFTNKSKKKKQLFYDHPTEVGVVLFDK
jgi:hypothetical protein